MTARREQFVNDAQTTLNGAINAIVTSVTVTDGSVFPATGDFRILIGDELLLVTARATNVLTVERGVEGTTGASQGDGATVTAIVTAGAFEQVWDDIYGGYSDRPPYRILDKSNNELDIGDFTWVNQSTATAANDTWGGITMTTPAVSGDNHRILALAKPSTPYTLKAFCLFGPGYNVGSTGSSIGILQRESATNKIKNISMRAGDLAGGFETRWYNSETSFNSEKDAMEMATDRTWFQIEDDGTNTNFSVSADGINWFETHTELSSTHWTTAYDQVGLYCNSYNSLAGALYHFYAWVIE